MADYRSSRMHEDLDPSATSAVGAAYDTTLQSLESGGAELLRYSLAHLGLLLTLLFFTSLYLGFAF